MNKLDKNIERKEFDEYIHAISMEIEQAQVKLISAANVQMLLHYWKIGHFILYNQTRLGWGSKFIERTSEALRKLHPQRKGYSPRNLKYMCQFAKAYSLDVLRQLHWADQELESPTIEKILSITNVLSESEFGQEALAQIAHPADLQIRKDGSATLAISSEYKFCKTLFSTFYFALFCAVNLLSAYKCFKHFGGRHIAFVSCYDISIKYRKIGVLTGFYASLSILFERCFSSPNRHRA